MQQSDSLARLTLIEGPPAEPLTLSEVKAHLRIDSDDENGLITSLIVAARQHIDGKDGRLGRALIAQTWELALTAFPCGAISLPLPPLREVESIAYVDTAGATQTLASNLYQVVASEPALILPAYGKTWPATRCQPEAVKVRFTAGYEPGDGSPTDYAENIPQPIKQAMLLLIAQWCENRSAVATGATPMEMPFAVQALLTPYKVGGGI